MQSQQEPTVLDHTDQALAELESARRAAEMAKECADQADALAREGSLDMAIVWADGARHFANVALGHSTRTVRMCAPLSRVARDARDAADRAGKCAESAEGATRK